MEKPVRITKKTFNSMVEQWAQVAKYEESACIYMNSKHNAWRRIQQLMEDEQLVEKYFKSEGIEVKVIDLEASPLEDEHDLRKLLFSGQTNEVRSSKTVYFVLGADVLLKEKRLDILHDLAELKVKNHWSYLLFFNTDYTHPDYWPIISQYNIFLMNTIFFPLYGREDSEQLITYLSYKWKVNPSNRVRQMIVNNCGGYFWLVVQAMRTFRNNPGFFVRELLQTEDMKIKLEVTWERFLPSEKAVILKVVKGQADFSKTERHSLNFLRKIQVLERTKNGYALQVPILEDFIVKLETPVKMQVTDDSMVVLNGVNVSSHFSTKEKTVLVYLLKNQGVVVSRQQLAKEIWGEGKEGDYSDWALDQIITRLRKKLSRLNVAQKSLKTVKRKGFKFDLTADRV